MNEQSRCEYLVKRTRFDEVTGKLFWLPKQGSGRYEQAFNTRLAGCEIDSKTKSGYGQVRFCYEGVTYSQVVHRLIWFIVHGIVPTGVIDHKNGNKSDNRPSNLRDETQSINMRNAGLRSDNTSGVAGIHFVSKKGKWVVQSVTNTGEHVHVGIFADLDSAKESLVRFRQQNNYTERHGISDAS